MLLNSLISYHDHVFQEYSEWKTGIADVCLPTVYVNRMDHLPSYVRVVTDATQELCDLILSYREKMKSGEFMSYCILSTFWLLIEKISEIFQQLINKLACPILYRLSLGNES